MMEPCISRASRTGTRPPPSGQFNALYCQLHGAVGFMKRHLHEGPLLTQPTLLEIFSHIRDHRPPSSPPPAPSARRVLPPALENRYTGVIDTPVCNGEWRYSSSS